MPEESQLPDALQAVEGRGVPGLAIALLLLIPAALALEEVMPFMGISMLVMVLGFPYLFLLITLRREGFSIRQSQRVLWREPAWWLWWYPRPLRRRGNVWERLPLAVRGLRWWVLALIVFSIVGPLIVYFWDPPNDWTTFMILEVSVLMIVAIWIGLAVRARRDLKRGGLARGDIFRVMYSVPPSRASFWSRPHIAAILAPAPAEARPRSDSPHDYLQSIRRDADQLSGPLRPLAAEAAVAARQLVDSIGEADRQIADLARSLEPGEEERLADKIEALRAVEEYAPMRSLLEKQLQLVREMSARIEEARERRNRRLEMLKTLSLHVASLRARLAQTPSEVRLLSDKVRALCDEIGRQSQSLGDRGEAGPEPPTIDRLRPSTP